MRKPKELAYKAFLTKHSLKDCKESRRRFEENSSVDRISKIAEVVALLESQRKARTEAILDIFDYDLPPRRKLRKQRKRRRCLRCGKLFMSEGPWNRICPRCAKTEVPFPSPKARVWPATTREEGDEMIVRDLLNSVITELTTTANVPTVPVPLGQRPRRTKRLSKRWNRRVDTRTGLVKTRKGFRKSRRRQMREWEEGEVKYHTGVLDFGIDGTVKYTIEEEIERSTIYVPLGEHDLWSRNFYITFHLDEKGMDYVKENVLDRVQGEEEVKEALEDYAITLTTEALVKEGFDHTIARNAEVKEIALPVIKVFTYEEDI